MLRAARLLSALVVALATVSVFAAESADDATRIHFYRWGVDAGVETQRTLADGSIEAKVDYVFRGDKASLVATMRTKDGALQHVTLRGNALDRETKAIDVDASAAASALREPLPLAFVRYRLREGSQLGTDRLTLGRGTIALTRWSLPASTWGWETVWLDAQGNVAGAIIPMGSYQLAAAREGLEPLLSDFFRIAATDAVQRIEPFAKRLTAARTIAIVNGLVFGADGTAAPSRLLIHHDRIVNMGPDIEIPINAFVIDAKGQTVIPGLWDMHAHLAGAEWAPAYLAAGVTTVRDLGNDFSFITTLRDASRNGAPLLPRMYLAGFIDGPTEHPVTAAVAATEPQARALVARYAEAGFDQIKVWNDVSPAMLAVIANEAHKRRLRVTGHVPAALDALRATELGQDSIDHLEYVLRSIPTATFDTPDDVKFLATLKERGVVIGSTISLDEFFARDPKQPAIANAPRVIAKQLESLAPKPADAKALHDLFNLELKLLGALHRAGIIVVAGTDQGVPGASLHRELELLVQAGFTPAEALQAATIIPARVMSADRDLGTIEIGKVADLVIVDGNPASKISDVRNVRLVMRQGRLYDAAGIAAAAR